MRLVGKDEMGGICTRGERNGAFIVEELCGGDVGKEVRERKEVKEVQ